MPTQPTSSTPREKRLATSQFAGGIEVTKHWKAQTFTRLEEAVQGHARAVAEAIDRQLLGKAAPSTAHELGREAGASDRSVAWASIFRAASLYPEATVVGVATRAAAGGCAPSAPRSDVTWGQDTWEKGPCA